MTRGAATCLALLAACSAEPRPPLAEVTLPGRFTDVTPQVLPGALTKRPGGVDQPTGGVFADLDGDGHDELVLSADDGSKSYRWDITTGAFVPLVPAPQLANGLLLGLVDLDGDGQLDELSGRRFVQWGPLSEMSPPDAFIGEAKWGEAGNLVATDVDGDGRLDLVGGGPCCWDEACRDVAVFLQEAPRRFRLLGADSGLPTAPGVRSYLGAVLPLDPEPLVARIGEPCGAPGDLTAFFRAGARDPAGFPRFSGFDPLPPNAMYREGRPDRTLTELSPMGIAAGDLDNDGRVDLVVSTNPILEILQGTDSWPMVTRTAGSGIARHPGPENFLLPWGIAVADFDRDGKADLAVAHGDDLNSRNNPDAHVGPQQMALYANQGSFRFADASRGAGLPTGQWKSVVVGDFDCDGDADLVVGGQDEWPRVMRNDLEGGHGLSFKLRGTNGDPRGDGARLEVFPEGGEVQHVVAGGQGTPATVGAPMAFAGLGSAQRAKTVRISWPSGFVQELADVAADRCVVVEEPRVFEVNPASRTVPKDGTATLRVVPRDPSGQPSHAHAEVKIASGPGTLDTAEVADGIEVSIRGTGPGSTVLDILIDGTPMRVHPRIWWAP